MNNHNFIYNGRELFAFGRNAFGQLGLGDFNDRYTPTLVMIDGKIQQIVCGESYTFILRESGELFAFGFNGYGQLGLGQLVLDDDNVNRNIPTLLMMDKEIQQIICGWNHTFILRNSGELFAFGCNVRGQLGLGDDKDRYKPTLVMQDNRIRQIICGDHHSFILKESGELFAFGDNHYGQLGLCDSLDRNVPTLLIFDSNIKQIICGFSHSFILKNNGELFSFGRNNYGQLGLDDYKNRNVPTLMMKDENIRQIVCGKYHTLILKESGELFAFGHNEYGQLGLNDYTNRNFPTLIMRDENIEHIICGGFHTFVIKKINNTEQKELFVFGNAIYNQLGLGDRENRSKPTLLGTFENMISINGKIIKIKWSPDIYPTLSDTKQNEIANFLLVCRYYKQVHKINVIKYMRHMIISLLF